MGGRTYHDQIEERRRYKTILAEGFATGTHLALSKLFLDWQTPTLDEADDLGVPCPVALLIFWPIALETNDSDWTSLDGDRLFTYCNSQSEARKEILVFSVQAYIAALINRGCIHHELAVNPDSPLQHKLHALQAVGVF